MTKDSKSSSGKSARKATNGQYTTIEYAKKHPSTTVIETNDKKKK